MSQAGFITSSGSGPVSSVTGIQGITSTPTTGGVIVFPSNNPNQYVYDFDDFIQSDNTGSKLLGDSTGTFISGTATNPGQIEFTDAAFAYVFIDPSTNAGSNCFVLGGGQLTVNWVFNLVALSTVPNNYLTQLGIMDSNAAANQIPPIDGCFFSYTDGVNGGKWQATCMSATVATTVDTGILANTSYNNFGIIVNPAASSVGFYINQVLVATIATNIPTASISPGIFTTRNLGVLPAQLTDLFYYSQFLTVAR